MSKKKTSTFKIFMARYSAEYEAVKHVKKVMNLSKSELELFKKDVVWFPEPVFL